MKRYVLGTAAVVATLSMASAANAAVTVVGTSGANTTVNITDNVNVPNRITFDTVNVGPGSVTAFFDFSESYASQAIFTVGAATLPNSTITLVELLTGTPLTLVASAGPAPNTLTFTSGNLLANTTYRFRYTANLGSAGNISGNAAFYNAVPEPATWAMMLLGFGGIGMAMRRRRQPALAQVA